MFYFALTHQEPTDDRSDLAHRSFPSIMGGVEGEAEALSVCSHRKGRRPPNLSSCILIHAVNYPIHILTLPSL